MVSYESEIPLSTQGLRKNYYDHSLGWCDPVVVLLYLNLADTVPHLYQLGLLFYRANFCLMLLINIQRPFPPTEWFADTPCG